MSDARYRAFISYSHEDSSWGKWLHRSLETFRIPSALADLDTPFGKAGTRLTPIFRDREDLPASSDLSEEIKRALESSAFLIVICSPSAARSRWVDLEIRRFREIHGDDRILAAIVGGEPNAATNTDDTELQECLPPSLRRGDVEGAGLPGSFREVIAADFRSGGDGKRYGRSKLVAGMLGVRLDDLVRRESQRRIRRLTLSAGISVSISLCLAALTAATLMSRAEAVSQRESAQQARQDAESLIEFMLTDLRRKLDAVGRLDALDAVGARALRYYESQTVSTTDADSLGRRARTQLLVGEVASLRGDLDDALAAYKQAALTTEEQLRREPHSEQRIFDHAQSIFWIGNTVWERGDIRAAVAYMEEYLEYAGELVALNPGKAEWKSELGYAYGNLGTLHFAQRQWPEGLRYMRESLKVSQAAAASFPGDIQARLNLGQDYSYIGETLAATGKFAEAGVSFDHELSVYDEILRLEPDHRLAKSRSVWARIFKARLSLDTGALQPAIDELEALQQDIRELMRGSPDYARLLEARISVDLELASAYGAAGRANEAREVARIARDMARQLAAQDEKKVFWQSLFGRALVPAEEELNPEGPVWMEIEGHLDRLVVMLSDAPADPFLLAPALELGEAVGLKAMRSGNPDTAQTRWQSAVDLAPRDPRFQLPDESYVLLRLQRLLKNGAESERLRERLRSIGYRHPGFVRMDEPVIVGR